MQKNEITFKFVLTSFVRRINLRYRQLCVFVMHYHCEVSKKFNEKNFLIKLRVILNITTLREIIDFANCLKFESFEIIALKQFSKLVDLTIIRENEKFALVINDLEKSKKK